MSAKKATQASIIYLRDTDAGDPKVTEKFFSVFADKLASAGLSKKVQLVKVADIGIYGKGIAVKILPSGTLYAGVKEEDIDRIIRDTVEGGKEIKELACETSDKQLRIVLRNCGVIDPESMTEYIARDGYEALHKVLFEMTPDGVIEELKTAGLRGRGGGGFPTWMKWSFASKVESDVKYVICNADEGDPGAYMDRSVLEGDPHAIVEGMIIAGYSIGATNGFFYIRAEYPLAIERARKAIDQAYEAGILGKNIMGSDFSFDLDIRLGAGAFVCGEETALIASIEGKRGTPRPRPPYPSIKGLWGKPTVINNVETLANIATILRRGGKWFAGIGLGKSTGTKVFALTGKIKNCGLIEVPMGITLREIVMDIGGGVPEGRDFKAIQTGGPSGGVIPCDYFDTKVSYENLMELGSIMGSGGMIVIDDTDCMVDISKFYLGFCVEESCGKCAPCRIGGFQLLHILTKITQGKGSMEDIRDLKKISHAMQKASLCGLGQTAPNPVVSTLKYFEDEYQMHIVDRKCPAGVCQDLLTYRISRTKCVKCGQCKINCPADAISGSRAEGYEIDEDKCIKCGRCAEVCKFDAVLKA